jgi:hypothetical protein
METLARTRDMMPDSAPAKGASAVAASLLMVQPELVWGLVAVVVLNAISSLWYALHTDQRTATMVLYWLGLRIGVYLLVLPGLIIFSNMLGVDVLKRLVFGAAAGWEVAVTMGLGARISPRFRPIYERAMDALDKHTPLDLDSSEVGSLIDRDEKKETNA